jgi:hypothetical protein
MKHLIVLTFVILSTTFNNTFAQKKPLLGSGKIERITYTKIGYDKINLKDFEGKIEIVLGKSHNIVIDIDDNLAKLVTFELDSEENELTVSIVGNKNGKLYLENIHSKIVINMPEASVIRHRGNSNMIITQIKGRYFRLEHQGNGDVRLSGKIEELDISKTGNGSIFAENLLSNSANISSIGNGDVKINASESFYVKGAGNGDMIQFGKGYQKPFSGIIGNGNIIRSQL